MTGSRYKVIAALVGVVAALLILALGVGFTGRGHGPSSEAPERQTAGDFFRTINARSYEKTCDLMAAEFYRENHVRNRSLCALALKIEFMWAPNYRFRIVGVRVDGRRAVVEAVANGAPGQVTLLKENGHFKVVSVSGR